LKLAPLIDLFGSDIRPRILSEDKSIFFSTFLEVPTAKIVYLGPEPREIRINRPPRKAQGAGQINTAFADSGPYLLVTEKSFSVIKAKLPAESKVDIIRFRPNIVVGGTRKAWDEDDWKEISIGEAGRFFVVARCPRCLLPKQNPTNNDLANHSVDLATGVKAPKNEPFRTLIKYAAKDDGRMNKPCFGMLCVSNELCTGRNWRRAKDRWHGKGWR